MKNQLKFNLEINNKIYNFSCDSNENDKINFSYLSKFTYNSKQIKLSEFKNTFSKLLTLYCDKKIDSFENRSEITDKLVDYMEFIQIINYELQIQEALLQMISLIWNNNWVLKIEYTKLSLKNFLVKMFDKSEVAKHYYIIMFLFDSIHEKKVKEEYNFDLDLDDIDFELDNNSTQYLESDDEYADFHFI